MTRETAVVNGAVYTVDGQGSRAEAVLVRDGRVAAVGSTTCAIRGGRRLFRLRRPWCGGRPRLRGPAQPSQSHRVRGVAVDCYSTSASTMDDLLETIRRG